MQSVSTDHLPPDERFAFWREISSRTWVPYDSTCEPALVPGFNANMAVCELGAVQLALMKTTPYGICRTAKLIRQADPELCKLSVAVRGAGGITQDERHAEFAVGDLILYDTSRPYFAALKPDIRTSQLLVLRFPRSLLPLPESDLRRLTAVRIPGTHGVGSLSSNFLLHVARHITEYSPADMARLSGLALDLLAAAFAHALDADKAVPLQTRQRAMAARIYAFIQQNLGDPAMTPGSIAAAHHISLRYLHKLFHEQGRTVAGWIRERRLERCRHDLSDPLMAHHPISTIAARWGFRSAARFSQAFRDAFRISPGEYRRQHSGVPVR